MACLLVACSLFIGRKILMLPLFAIELPRNGKKQHLKCQFSSDFYIVFWREKQAGPFLANWNKVDQNQDRLCSKWRRKGENAPSHNLAQALRRPSGGSGSASLRHILLCHGFCLRKNACQPASRDAKRRLRMDRQRSARYLGERKGIGILILGFLLVPSIFDFTLSNLEKVSSFALLFHLFCRLFLLSIFRIA